jgi:hypothetical protein
MSHSIGSLASLASLAGLARPSGLSATVRAGADLVHRAGLAGGRLNLALFVVLQLADGLITYEAVRLFGTAAEGNPLLATWIAIAGAAPTLLGAKLLACGCAVFLYRRGIHTVLAALTIFYLLAAVGPWLHLLSTVSLS